MHKAGAVKSSVEQEPVYFSITVNGQHCGNFWPFRKDAEAAAALLNASYPDDVRAVVPLYTSPIASGKDAKDAEIERLRGELERLTAEIADPRLAGLHMHEGMLEMGLRGAGVQMFAEMFAAQFKEVGAVNYIEATMVSKDPDIGELVVTLQRKQGKTPHQLRMEAEAALAQKGGGK